MNIVNLTVGYAGFSKASWMTPKIERIRDEAVESLRGLGVKLVCGKGIATSEADAIEAAEEFRRQGVDVVVMHFLTFPVGSMIPALASRIDAPTVLFANPEAPAAGGLWERNSFCGANMAAHVMRKLGKPVRFAWGEAADAGNALLKSLRVVEAEKALRDARIGLVGGRVPGFYTSNVDELKLRRKFGSTVEAIELVEVLDLARRLDSKDAEEGMKRIRGCAQSVCGAEDEELALAGRLFAAFLKTAEKYKLTSLAIRCWPELPDIYGIAPCAVIGALNDAGYPASCEGDVPGALSMVLLKAAAGGGTPLFMDFISFDEKDNTGVVWHCGAAPSSLCRDFKETALRKHMRVDGGDRKGLTNDFSLKPGRVTICKLDESESGHRMLIFSGTAVDTDKFIRGNPLRIKFDSPVGKIVDCIMKNGFEHHYSVIHADVKAELLEFCACNGIELFTA